MKVISKLFVLMFMVVAVVSMANAAEPIGRIVKIRGEVEASNKTSGDSAVLKDGDSIFEGDLLKSQKGSFAKILMKDDTIFQLGPNTEMLFEKFKFRSKSKRTATYNLVKGQLRSLFTVKSKEKSLMIKTPNTAMGIRGTEILSDVYKFKGKVKTDIALMSGKLDVDLSAMKLGEALKQRVIQLKPGQVFESDHFRKNFTGGKPIQKLLRKLPKQVFKNLKRPEKKGGQVFLMEARKQVRRDLYNGARFNFDRSGQDIKKEDLKEGKGPKVDPRGAREGKFPGQGVKDKFPGQGAKDKFPGKGPGRASDRKLPTGIKPPVVVKERDVPGQANSRARVGVSRDELDGKASSKDKAKYQAQRRRKEMKERQRMMKNKQMEERKKQARMRREEMIRRRQEELARIRAEEIKKIIFGRFSQWHDSLSRAQAYEIRQKFGVDKITPELFCRIKPAACAF